MNSTSIGDKEVKYCYVFCPGGGENDMIDESAVVIVDRSIWVSEKHWFIDDEFWFEVGRGFGLDEMGGCFFVPESEGSDAFVNILNALDKDARFEEDVALLDV